MHYVTAARVSELEKKVLSLEDKIDELMSGVSNAKQANKNDKAGGVKGGKTVETDDEKS